MLVKREGGFRKIVYDYWLLVIELQCTLRHSFRLFVGFPHKKNRGKSFADSGKTIILTNEVAADTLYSLIYMLILIILL